MNELEGLCFRPVSEDDFEPLVALRILVMREHLERVGRFDPERARVRFRTCFDPAHTRVVVLADSVAGCLDLRPDGGKLELSNFYLYPAHHRTGLGSAIMRRLLPEMDAAHVPTTLTVLKGNPAGRFYQRHGFFKVGELAWDDIYERPAGRTATPSPM